MRNPGKLFEDDFKNSVPEQYYYKRIPDPPQSFGQDSEKTRFSSKNPYDAILFDTMGGILYTLELKSTKGGGITFWKEDAKPNKTCLNIKKHQIMSLLEADKKDRVVSGLVLNFRDTEHTYFLPIKEFLKFSNQTEKISINEKDVLKLTHYQFEAIKKITRFQYEIETFLKFNRKENFHE